MLTEQELSVFIAKSKWQFAKTMPKSPHWYTLRKNAVCEGQFLAFVEHIRAYGYDEKFARARYRYLDFQGYTYWTMGFILPVTILINRAELNRPERSHSLNVIPFNAKPPTKHTEENNPQFHRPKLSPK